MVVNLVDRAVEEKQQLLNLVFQNLKLYDKNPSTHTFELFSTILDYKKHS